RALCDAGADAPLVHQPSCPLDRLTRTHHTLAVEQFEAVPVLEHGRDVALVHVAQALDPFTERRVDGEDLDVRVLLLEEAPSAHQRAGSAETGDEVRDLGDVTPDLW